MNLCTKHHDEFWMTHVNDIVPRNFVEACVDMKQQGVAGYDSWDAKVQSGYTIPANQDYE